MTPKSDPEDPPKQTPNQPKKQNIIQYIVAITIERKIIETKNYIGQFWVLSQKHMQYYYLTPTK